MLCYCGTVDKFLREQNGVYVVAVRLKRESLRDALASCLAYSEGAVNVTILKMRTSVWVCIWKCTCVRV